MRIKPVERHLLLFCLEFQRPSGALLLPAIPQRYMV